MFNKTFKLLMAAIVPVILLAAAAPAQARLATFNDAPKNDSRAKAAVNRALAEVRAFGPEAVADARVRCGAARGGAPCADDQNALVIDGLVGHDDFYRGAYALEGNSWSVEVKSLSTGTEFGFSQGRRVCSNPGRGGCPASGTWGGRGFAIKLTTQGFKSR